MTPTTWPFRAETIAARLALISAQVQRRRSALPHFKILPLSGAMVDAPIDADPAGWDEIPHQSYWGQADLNFVLQTTITVPQGWNADHIALHLPLGVLGDIFNHPEALVFLDKTPIGSADRYHHTITLAPACADGKAHRLALHGWTGLAGWPPDPKAKAKLFMGEPALVERDPCLLAFVQLAQSVLETAQKVGNTRLLDLLYDAIFMIDTGAPIGDDFYRSVPAALAHLQDNIGACGDPLDVTLHGIGHAHMDIAYLWPIDQIRLKNARTYSNVLRLMDQDPDYRFSHSQPQLYDYTARDYPELFAQIKTRIAEGRWEIMGGMWVEPDLNIPGGEALIRQLTLGRGYFKETFGDVETPVLWLPDTFGFPAQTPQLMQLAGLEWFVTNKLNWNQYNAVPSTTHHWQGLDGSCVLAHILTTPRDVQYLPFPTNYKSDLSAGEVLGTWTAASSPDALRDLPVCYGYGDGGGGPTEDLLAKARAYRQMPGMPQLHYSTVRATFEAMENTPDLPVWQGEHYMEGHRGTYTSQGWIKRANRKAEWALHEAEAMAAMAGQTPDLIEAWQLLCLNQFHDIITGTSIGQVFEDARQDFKRIRQIVEDVAQAASKVLGLQDGCVINTSPVSGPRLALVEENCIGGQATDNGTLVYFDHLQSYAVTALSQSGAPQGTVTCKTQGDTHILENDYIKVVIDAHGQLEQVFDKDTKSDVLEAGARGNQLIAFEDRPICWDAWDIDPTYEDRFEMVQGLATIKILEDGPLRACVEVTTRWRRSEIRQRIQLSAHSKRLDFVTNVDWHEQHWLLKAAFPTAVDPQVAQFDVQWGRVTRSARRDTPFDAARFEVPAHKWASVCDDAAAVAVLNDCKYGYDVLGGRIRITLIKSATSPDPEADQGHHQFTYALLPYDQSKPQMLDREAYDLNAPLRSVGPYSAGVTAAVGLVQSEANNVIIETVKPADDGQGIVLRVFEAHGLATQTDLRFGARIEICDLVSIFEIQEKSLTPVDDRVTITLAPFQIMTLKVRLCDPF